MLCCTVLCCAVLYCTVLYCTWEAVYTAIAWSDAPDTTRGGPWVLKWLSKYDTDELRKVGKHIQPYSHMKDKVPSLRAVARQLPPDGHLNRHLNNLCYGCGSALGIRCGCKSHGLAVQHADPPVKFLTPAPMKGMAASITMTKTKPATMSTMKASTGTFKSRSGTRTPGRSGARLPGKSGHAHRKALGLKYSKGGAYAKHKWGRRPKKAISKAQKKYRGGTRTT